jgi:glycosyltransferase involved in cell wall biosynthesis
MRMKTWRPERRLPAALRQFQKVVVPDAERARLLQIQTGLLEAPSVVPNYPKLAPPYKETAAEGTAFDVIYSGSLAFDKKLDVIIKSVRLWPERARLTLLGDDTRPEAQQLKRVARDAGLAGRVHFEGWLALDVLAARLRQAHLAISLLDSTTDQWKFSVGASNKRYQYMQAGLAQIGDANPGVPELLAGHGVGRCPNVVTEGEIADLVSYYASHDVVRRQEGRRAELLYRERLNYDTAFRPLLDWILTEAHRHSNRPFHVLAAGESVAPVAGPRDSGPAELAACGNITERRHDDNPN